MTAPSDNFDFQNFYSATLTSDITAGDLTIPLDIAPTPTEGVLIIDPDAVAPEVIFYTSKGASSVTCPADGRGWDSSSATTHGQGTTVIMAPTAYAWRMLKQGSLFDSYRTGWTTLGYAPNTVAANGNRSYDLTFSGVNLTGTVSNGMRLKLPRTVTPPTQCTSLNGSTQYWNKTSGLTAIAFTDDFVVSAWVKLSSYPASGASIVSRYNGTSGWDISVDSQGRIASYGYNGGSSNLSGHFTYQALPLNKWVHIAVQVDMSSYPTASATTNYAMFDGVNAPTQTFRSGTNPTSLVQQGNLEIGSRNGGTLPFPGKIAQVALYNAKVTQATILASMNQTLTGSETSLLGAWTFNGNGNDSSSNALNLTAQGSAVATNTDSPMNATEYGIIMASSYSTNTVLTVQVPEGYTLPTSGGIGTAYYSANRSPYGFPSDREKWVVDSIYLSVITTAASAGTAYNPGSASLTIPVGAWKLNFEGNMYFGKSAASSGQVVSLLSTAAASSTPLNYKMSSTGYLVATGATVVESISRHGCNPEGYTATTATTVYANLYAELSLTTLGWFANTAVKGKALAITAENAFL